MTDSVNIFAVITKGGLGELQSLVDGNAGLAMARDDNGVSALLTAVYYRKQEMVQYLVDRVPALDLFEASALGDAGRVGQLMSAGQVVNSQSPDGFTPLHLAAFLNQPECARLLLAHGAAVNAVAANPSRVQPLHSATACQSLELVGLLLEHGAEVNARQHGGWTALQAAAKHGSMELVELLLRHGADPTQATDDGQTAKTMAANEEIRDRLNKIN